MALSSRIFLITPPVFLGLGRVLRLVCQLLEFELGEPQLLLHLREELEPLLLGEEDLRILFDLGLQGVFREQSWKQTASQRPRLPLEQLSLDSLRFRGDLRFLENASAGLRGPAGG